MMLGGKIGMIECYSNPPSFRHDKDCVKSDMLMGTTAKALPTPARHLLQSRHSLLAKISQDIRQIAPIDFFLDGVADDGSVLPIRQRAETMIELLERLHG
jgi:hypothetical protein